VVNTAIKTWQIGVLGIYNLPLDGNGTQSLLFQPLIVKQLGEGWYTGWGDDLWQFNTFVTGAYVPDELRKGPAPEWGIKFSVSLLKAD